MGNIIQIENGVKTIYVNGQDITSLTADTNTYYVGVDVNSGFYEKLNPNGTIVNLESGSFSDITYADLVSMIGTNSLVSGNYYQISDFETIYDQPDYYIDGIGKGQVTTKTSSNEPLTVLAISTSGISKQVFQVNRPNDNLQYDITFSSTEVNGSPAKGRISELIDGNGNRTDYDHTNIEFKRYQNYERNAQLTGTILDYDCTTGLVVGDSTLFLTDVSIGDIILLDTYVNLGYNVGVIVAGISDDTNMYVYVDSNYNGTIFSSINCDFYNSNATGPTYNSYKEIYVAQSDLLDYSEYTTFPNTNLVVNNYIGDFAKFNSLYGFQFILTNNVFGTDPSVTNFYSNKIGDLSYNNHIDGDIGEGNEIGYNFVGNVIIYDHNFKSNFIGNYFVGNKVGDDFQYNTIGDQCQYNTIGTAFQDNKIGNYFQYNTTINGFRLNNIQTNTLSSVNFSASTYVYADYNCTIFKRDDGLNRISYFSGDTLTVNNVDA